MKNTQEDEVAETGESVSVKGSIKSNQRAVMVDPEPKEKAPVVQPTAAPTAPESNIEARLNALETENRVLRDAMRQDRLQASDERIKGKKEELRRGFLKRLQGKVVVAWLSTKDVGSKAEQRIVYQNNMPVGEVMIGHYKTLSGEDIVCEMKEFTDAVEQEWFEILSQDNKTGDMVVRFIDPTLPQSFAINKRFINP